MTSSRLFVAVWPPPDVLDAVEALPTGGGRRTPRARLHVTLRFLGDVPDLDLPALTTGLGAAVAAAVDAPVDAALGARTATFGRSILHVPVDGLVPLAAAVATGCAGHGAGEDADRPFVGHLTLARGRRESAGDLRRVAGAEVPPAAQAPWPVHEVTLVRSAAGAAGPRYDVLERYALPSTG